MQNVCGYIARDMSLVDILQMFKDIKWGIYPSPNFTFFLSKAVRLWIIPKRYFWGKGVEIKYGTCRKQPLELNFTYFYHHPVYYYYYYLDWTILLDLTTPLSELTAVKQAQKHHRYVSWMYDDYAKTAMFH